MTYREMLEVLKGFSQEELDQKMKHKDKEMEIRFSLPDYQKDTFQWKLIRKKT